MSTTAALIFSLLLLPAPGAAAQGQVTELELKLDAQVSESSLSASGLADAILRIARQFELPVGIEWVTSKDALRSVSLTWKGGTVRDIVTRALKEYPGYAFRVEQGVVHVFRADLVNDRHNFLNLKVPDFFEIHQEVGGLANQRLQAVVQNIVSPRNLPPGAGEAGDYASGVNEKPITLTLQGLTVREALDKLVEASEHKVWIVTFSGSSTLTPSGFLRTETLWHPTPFPDRDQPMWDFLAWSELLP